MVLVKSVCGCCSDSIAVVGTAVVIMVWLGVKARNLPDGQGYGWYPLASKLPKARNSSARNSTGRIYFCRKQSLVADI